MARGLAFIQLIIISLGVFALHILGRLNHPEDASGIIPSLAYFLGRYAPWFILFPILWAIVGNILIARWGEKTTNAIGVALTAILFVIFAVPLFWHLA